MNIGQMLPDGCEKVKESGRFSIHEGSSRENFLVVTTCKTVSAQTEVTPFIVGEIDEEDTGCAIKFGGTDYVGTAKGLDEAQTMAMEAAAVLYGPNMNMVIDIRENPVRLTNEFYKIMEPEVKAKPVVNTKLGK